MDIIIKEGNILEFKALILSRSVLSQLVKFKPIEAMPELIGWVNEPAEWYIAKHEGRLVKIDRVDMWEFFNSQFRGKNFSYAEINKLLDEGRDKLPQIFVK